MSPCHHGVSRLGVQFSINPPVPQTSAMQSPGPTNRGPTKRASFSIDATQREVGMLRSLGEPCALERQAVDVMQLAMS